MIHAELHSKCGNICEQEDALTSTVFGILKYSAVRHVLWKFIGLAKNMETGERYDPQPLGACPEFKFWERLSPENEIDLELRHGEYRLGIEVKYHAVAGPSQLQRYSQFVDHVIYLTMDTACPELPEINPKMYWLSWLELHKVVKSALKTAAGMEEELLTDLLGYIEGRNIRLFDGFNSHWAIPAVPDNFFWRDRIFNRKAEQVSWSNPIFFKGDK